MAKVLVIYESDYGNTKKAAEAVVEGVNSVNGATATLKVAEEVTAEDMLSHDAYIMGSPVHMGCMDWRLKQFIDKVCSKLWMGDKLVGRVGGVFTTGSGFGSAGGGCEITMLSMYNNFAELGLILVPLPKCTPGYKDGGLQWGPYARSASPTMEQTGTSKESLEVVKNHGANIARVALATKGKELFCR
jgi:NAD(P)H dehydrogenase (quinone)